MLEFLLLERHYLQLLEISAVQWSSKRTTRNPSRRLALLAGYAERDAFS